MIEHRLHARCGCAHAARAASSPGPFALPGTRRVYERARPFTVTHLALDWTLDVDAKSLEGTARISFERKDALARELALDAVAFTIERVELIGAGARGAARHTYDGDTLRIEVPPRLTRGEVRVTYRATPQRGMYFLAPDEHVRDRPRQVWTQCQDEDARHIFPCVDKPHVKATLDLTVRVPRGWTTLSNGELVSSEKRPQAKLWRYRWSMKDPLPSYLVTLVAGELVTLDGGEAAGVPVTYLVPAGREADGQRAFGRTPAMIELFGRLTGVAYPWNKYAQVAVSDFIFGGMENTSATTMYEHVLLDEKAALDITSDDLVAHELAHQWFGDYVTCRDWSHAWLNEGFATFFEHLDREAHHGLDEYEYGLKTDLEAYVAESGSRYARPIVCSDYEAPIDLFDRHLYEKGGLVLHMLRRELGDATFWAGVRTYLERHARGVVETRDLLRALEDASGRSLEAIFDQWVLRAGHPELDVKIEHDAGVLLVTVKQTQAIDAASPAYTFPLELAIGGAGGKVRVERRTVSEACVTLAVPSPERPQWVVVDPAFALLADVKVEAPFDMLRRQLESAPTARGRWLAAAPLGKRADVPSLEALGRVLGDEKAFWGVRAEAAEALAVSASPTAFEALKRAVRTKHPKVRRAVVHALGSFHSPAAAELLAPLALADASYLVEAEAARALGATRQSHALDTLVDVLDRASWGDVVRVGALDGLGALRDDRALPHVVARTRYGVGTRGRRAAIVALPKLATDRRAREALEELLDDADPHLRVDVVRALLDLGDARSRGALAKRLDRELDGRVRRRLREALRDLATTPRAELTAVKDALEKLRGEHATLAASVAKLEAAPRHRKKR